MDETYYHLKVADYSINFPVALDVVPLLIQKRTFLDAWIVNMMFAMVLNIEQYLINHKSIIEV